VRVIERGLLLQVVKHVAVVKVCVCDVCVCVCVCVERMCV